MNLLKDDVSQLIKKLAIPASVGTLFQTLYTLVDTFYAGKISPEALSALSKSFPIYFLIIATSIGVTVAGTSLIGSSIGEKNEKNVIGYFTNIILYSVIISIIVSIIGFSFSEKLFLTMNSSREVITLGLEYTNVIFYGTILFILVVATGAAVAAGSTAAHLVVVVAVVVVVVAADFAAAVAAAAVACSCSRSCSCSCSCSCSGSCSCCCS